MIEIDINALVAKLCEKTNTHKLYWFRLNLPNWYKSDYMGVGVTIRKGRWFGIFSTLKGQGILLPVYELYVDGHSVCRSRRLLRPLFCRVVDSVKREDALYEFRKKKFEEDKVQTGVKKILEN